ncbi:TPA: hypothetical protein ACUWL5_001158 [Citrobacter gillenii]|uniref:hypothetical protein n=2 Tax=Citrobacter TaxID=544 RepID=UPI00157567CA|nr:hypothetical protein [Citrobacter freundii]
MGRAACTWVLGLITSEAGGIGAGLCLVTGIVSSIAGGKVVEKWGERYGKKVGATINDKVDSSNSIIRNPDSFNEEAGVLLYEKLFNH